MWVASSAFTSLPALTPSVSREMCIRDRLYAAMIVHVFWYEVPVLVSDLMIGACSLMIVISLLLYAKHNIRILKGEKRK